ncbi:MAG: transcription termination factor Rho [Patescibacteria group bacterium]|nr:transcription termination factor Rho [Patescibacteria group bacterium]
MAKNSNNNNNRNNYRDFGGENTFPVKGVLEIRGDFGVLHQTKPPEDKDLPRDVYVSDSQIRRFGLRTGDEVAGVGRPPKEGERYLSLLRVDKVESEDPEKASERPKFEDLTPVFPDEWLKLETDPDILTTRIVDLFSPVGRGQRGLIVSPPYAGKTWLLKDIANGIEENYADDVGLMVVLIGERPEEVTDMRRSVDGEVHASNFDEHPKDHTKTAEFALEIAKRRAEAGEDVIILLDSITRLARAYNLVLPPSGRTLSGGFDPQALYPPKHFFGAARNFEDAGSLTILATALVQTGSRMDELIYEEFKGTGNMELHLDRELAERRIFPAIDIKKSQTRHEELLLPEDALENVYRLRRMVDTLSEGEATQIVLNRLKKTENNEEFLETLHERM